MSFCHACKVVYWAGDVCDMCSAQVTIARQARTIRRLRALADGYRARWTHAIQVKEQIRTFDEMHGAAKERARIAAELRARAKYLIDSYGKAQENAAYEIYDLADAIERGEL